MPKFPLVSAKEVVARVMRGVNYRLPSSYLDDILEWIPEGLGMLQVTNALVTTSTGDMNCPGEILIRNHCGSLPCGLVTILAVEDECGRRLPEGTDVTDITSQTSTRHSRPAGARPNTFYVDPYVHQTQDGLPSDEAPSASVPYFGGDLVQDDGSSRNVNYYKIVGNYIQTSFEEGYVKIHYLSLPVDKEGYPLIPDNSAFKQALEFYVLMRLVGSGYQHPNPEFSYSYLDAKFEQYAARGMNEVSYYSPEGAAKLNRSLIRLIPPYNYYEDFGVGGEQPEYLRK